MKEMGFPKHLIHLLESLYHDQQAAIRIAGETSDWFEVQKGVRQGCILSSYLFNIYAENIMRNVRTATIMTVLMLSKWVESKYQSSDMLMTRFSIHKALTKGLNN
jgi:hypothetical protein